MLIELRLENYAVIDNVAVDFAPGLNLLTGETGAGKSILVDALALLLGDKASSEVIRAGAEKAVIAAVFEVESGGGRLPPQKIVADILEAHGIDPEGDGDGDNDGDSNNDSIILRREIFPGGKGRVFVNNQPATVALLRQLAPHLASIHAQSETIRGFDAEARLALLDAFSGLQLDATRDAFATWKSIAVRIAELQHDEQDRLRLLDLWTFQQREIEAVKLQPQEDERLEGEKRVLSNAEKIYGAAINAFDLLYEGTASTSASLRSAQKHVEELIRYEPKFNEALKALDTARISVEDVGASLRDYAGGIEASPEHLSEVEDRLAVIDRLKRKYGPTLEDVLHEAAEVNRKLSEMENSDETLAQLRRELAQAAEHYLQASQRLSKTRYEAARKLEKLVEAEINDLAMKSKFHVDIAGTDEERNWTASGFDQATYMIATNPGEPMRPLEQVASGGELSRVMLALKATVEAGPSANSSTKKNHSGAQRTLVFDEIDIGIGGRAAEAVGKKLKALSRSNQVLCVTHLPQIASFADHHYVIEKKEIAGRTRTSLRRISGEERTEEVARMLSGAKLTDTSRKHAEQMLKSNA